MKNQGNPPGTNFPDITKDQFKIEERLHRLIYNTVYGSTNFFDLTSQQKQHHQQQQQQQLYVSSLPFSEVIYFLPIFLPSRQKEVKKAEKVKVLRQRIHCIVFFSK